MTPRLGPLAQQVEVFADQELQGHSVVPESVASKVSVCVAVGVQRPRERPRAGANDPLQTGSSSHKRVAPLAAG